MNAYGTGYESQDAVARERTVGMKRFGYALVGALSLMLLTAIPALAQGSNLPPPTQDDVGPQVIVRAPGDVGVVQAPGGVAFTGSEVTLWMVLAAALLAAGVTFYVLGRRRARAAAK